MRLGPSATNCTDADWIRNRLRDGLQLLSLGYRYAEVSDAISREYAVSFDSLRDAGWTECDVRWLLSQQFVEHLIEFTLPGDTQRSFRVAGVGLCPTSCLSLTEDGFQFALHSASDPIERITQDPYPGSSIDTTQGNHPIWDAERQELWFQAQLIKRYRLPSPNQTAILSAFEEDDWPARIDDPLSPRADQDPKRRLHDTIRNLNRSHRRPLLRFVGDGSGMGVLWEMLG